MESAELFVKEYEDAQKMIKILDENSSEWLRYNRHMQELDIPKQLAELDNKINKLVASAFRFLLTRQIEKLRQKEKELFDLLDKVSEERPWKGYSYPEFYLMDNVSQENLDNLISRKQSFVAENSQEYKYYMSILQVRGV